MSFVLFGLLFFSSDSLAEPNYTKDSGLIFFNSFFKNTDNLSNDDLFFTQNRELALETPDLKIVQDNSISAVSTPSVFTTQTLGDVFGTSSDVRKEVIDYTVQVGDTVESVAKLHGITPETIAFANSISKNATLKAGQNLVILPVSGVVYTIKNGDTLDQVIRKHSDKNHPVSLDEVVAFNNLVNPQDIFIGDTFIIPGGVILPQSIPSINIQVPLADNFFINPVEGIITQGLHFDNGVDIANKLGTSIYAAASGIVQRSVANGGYNLGMGNYITILHSNGTVTYYGHLQNVFVKSGDRVATGDRIASMGQTGKTTGSHLHFQVKGAKNPLARYARGTTIRFK